MAPAPAPTTDESSSSDNSIPAVIRLRPKYSVPTASRYLRSSTEDSRLEPTPSRTNSEGKRKPRGSISTRPDKRRRGQPSQLNITRTRTLLGVRRQEEETGGVDGDDGEEDDSDVRFDSSVFNAVNGFTKPLNTTTHSTNSLVIDLHSSRRGGPGGKQGNNLNTIEESPQSSLQERPAYDAEHARVEDIEEEAYEEEAEKKGHYGEGEDKDEGKDDDMEEDEDEGLFTDPTPTHVSLRSPELGFISPRLPPAPARGDIYDISSDEESANSTNSIPVPGPGLPAARQTVNDLTKSFQSKSTGSFSNQVPPAPHRHAPPFTASSAALSHGRHTRSRTTHPNASGVVSRTALGVAPEAHSPAAPVAALREFGSEDSHDDHYEEDEVQEYYPRTPEQDDSLFIQPPSNVAFEPTVEVSSKYITEMRNLMGRPGWTGLGKDWENTLIQNQAEVEETPVVTKVGVALFKYLCRLKEEFYKAPKAPELPHQNQWLLEQDTVLRKYITEIGKIITKIREDHLAVIDDSDRSSNNNLKLRRALVMDLLKCVIPALVQVLWSALSLGGVEDEDGSDTADLFTGRVFMASTLQYLVQATGWIRSLETVLRLELEVRPLGDPDPSPSATTQSRKKLSRPATISKNRGLLSLIITLWDQELRDAAAKLDENANISLDAETRIEEMKRREKEEKKRRARVEKEELEESQRKWEASCVSMALLKQKPRPSEELWRKATMGTGFNPKLPTSSLTSAPSSAPSMSGALPSMAQRAPPQAENPVLVEHEPLSREDKQYLLDELRRTDRKGVNRFDLETLAEILDRTVEGIVREINLLKQGAIDLSQKRRLPPESWSIRKESWSIRKRAW